MNNSINLCMGCMRPISADAIVCPHCAYNSKTVQSSPFLPTKTMLLGRYIIGKVLESTPDSAQYIAFDAIENKTVKIHEFLPEKLIFRPTGTCEVTVRSGFEATYYECLSSFESLWNALKSVDGFNVIDKVFDVFNLNNTAYAVCEYVRTITLEDFFSGRQTLLSYNKARAAFLPIIQAVISLAQTGIIHAELSPKTILVAQDGRLRLSGIRISRAHGAVKEISAVPYDGYAPIERYNDCEHLGFYTDVYSLAALFFTAMTGLTVPDARNRIGFDSFSLPAGFQSQIPQSAYDALIYALSVFPSSRMRSAQELLEALIPIKENKPDKQPQSEEFEVEIRQPQPKVEPQKVEPQKKAVQNDDEDESSPFAIVLKSFFCAVIVLAIVFTTLYTTFLYKYIEIPFFDTALSSFNFLPMNNDNSLNTTAQPQTTAETTAEIKTVTVADFTKLNYDTIRQNDVFNKSFNIVYKFDYSDTKAKNEIISQSIPAGQSVAEGTTITIVVSKGKEVVVLRDVVGMSYAEAFNVLTADGFVVEEEVTPNDGTHKANEVYDMSLVSGLKFEKGTKVILSVWGESTAN
ncbi:MAG: PASTA domain-containing protein [Acutalibacteraceae bacterium]